MANANIVLDMQGSTLNMDSLEGASVTINVAGGTGTANVGSVTTGGGLTTQASALTIANLNSNGGGPVTISAQGANGGAAQSVNITGNSLSNDVVVSNIAANTATIDVASTNVSVQNGTINNSLTVQTGATSLSLHTGGGSATAGTDNILYSAGNSVSVDVNSNNISTNAFVISNDRETQAQSPLMAAGTTSVVSFDQMTSSVMMGGVMNTVSTVEATTSAAMDAVATEVLDDGAIIGLSGEPIENDQVSDAGDEAVSEDTVVLADNQTASNAAQ